MSEPLLQVQDLVHHFASRQGVLRRARAGALRAVDGVSFVMRAGETLGLVGESGSGKSTTGRAVARLLEPTGGRITFDGRDITASSGRALRRLRRDIQLIFQDPYSALNPRHTIGAIIGAPYRVHRVRPPSGVRAEVQSLMELVGLNPEHYNRYPHEFSGGQRQRVGIARAIALRPKLIVCDEPVSALDVSIQAQVVNLLEDLQRELGVAYLFIAHDLSVVREISDRVAVMYLGKLMEVADRDALYATPRHPYTRALIAAAPAPDPVTARASPPVLLAGEQPSPLEPPSGCVFRTRCPKFRELLDQTQRRRCAGEVPALRPAADAPVGTHLVACHFPHPDASGREPDDGRTRPGAGPVDLPP